MCAGALTGGVQGEGEGIAPSWRNFCCPEEVRRLPKWDSTFNQNTLLHKSLIAINNMHSVNEWQRCLENSPDYTGSVKNIVFFLFDPLTNKQKFDPLNKKKILTFFFFFLSTNYYFNELPPKNS